MGAGNAQLGISWRLAERKKRLHSPDILLLLDPARGEQRFSSLSAQEAVSQRQPSKRVIDHVCAALNAANRAG